MVDRKLLIPVQNVRNSNAMLREGLEIGEVRLVDGLVANGNEVGPIVRSVDAEGVVGKGDVNAVQVSREERRGRMGDTFNLPHGILEPGQTKGLEELLLSCEDVFSLDDDDLGCTSLVQHKVNVGDHLPIKQIPW